MSEPLETSTGGALPLLSWARSAVAPKGGAFHALQPHEIAAPVLRALLARAGIAGQHVDAVVLGNAMGAGGNPARMTALAAGLPPDCAALSIDSQCCAGLDAVGIAAGLIASGQAEVVVAGGVEAWSRAPIRMTRPMHASEQPQCYERPAFAPDPAHDPDLLEAAAEHAFARGFSRTRQDAYALLSHERALSSAAGHGIVPVTHCVRDSYPRHLSPARAARMPVIAHAREDASRTSGLGTLAISAKADGAAMVLLASERACQQLGVSPQAHWLGSASVGNDPCMPLAAAATAARRVLQTTGKRFAGRVLDVREMSAIELHDAFAAQGLSFCDELGLAPEDINTQGGGLARGHPIGASGAIALVSLLTTLAARTPAAAPEPAMGLAAIAGAGGLGAACIVRLQPTAQ